MAKGKNCPQCGFYMFAKKETQRPAGTEVIYQCRKCSFEEKVFEDK